MSEVRTVKGVGWDVAAIGNGLFCPSSEIKAFDLLLLLLIHLA